MCLDKIDDRVKSAFKVRKSDGALYGWKLFDVEADGLHAFVQGDKQRANRWLKSKGKFLFARNGKYKVGFHIFARRADAVRLKKYWGWLDGPVVIRKVALRGKCMFGTERDPFNKGRASTVAVASGMLIPPLKKKGAKQGVLSGQ